MQTNEYDRVGNPRPNYYGMLEVDKNTSAADLKKAWHKKAMELHPDRHMDKKEDEKKEIAGKMSMVNQAYEILKDDEKKKEYDRYLENPKAYMWTRNPDGSYSPPNAPKQPEKSTGSPKQPHPPSPAGVNNEPQKRQFNPPLPSTNTRKMKRLPNKITTKRLSETITLNATLVNHFKELDKVFTAMDDFFIQRATNLNHNNRIAVPISRAPVSSTISLFAAIGQLLRSCLRTLFNIKPEQDVKPLPAPNKPNDYEEQRAAPRFRGR